MKLRIEHKLAILAVAMFGFGYLLVPFYNVFCQVAGINGKTGNIATEEAEKLTIDKNRTVTVEFDTNINGSLPWSFSAGQHELKVHPGEITDAMFVAENNSDNSIVGQAIPSVAPQIASLYFKKTECFCFTQQTLAPRERKEMLVRFVVNPDLPKDITTLTLSYTFFMVPGSNDDVAEQDTHDKNSTHEKSNI